MGLGRHMDRQAKGQSSHGGSSDPDFDFSSLFFVAVAVVFLYLVGRVALGV